jgi:hypothetical protein
MAWVDKNIIYYTYGECYYGSTKYRGSKRFFIKPIERKFEPKVIVRKKKNI